MLFDPMIELMEREQYHRVSVNVPEVYLYSKEDNEHKKYVFLVNTKSNITESIANIRSIALQLKQRLEQRDSVCHFLCILMANDVARFKELAQEGLNVWFIEESFPRLIIYENQKSDFGGLEASIEELLHKVTLTENIISQEALRSKDNNGQTQTQGYSKRNVTFYGNKQNSFPICSLILACINIVIFLLMDLGLDGSQFKEIMNQYGMRWDAIQSHGEYYRFLTAMFLHWDFNHLFNNMLVLFFVGQNLECVTSKIRFFIIYISSGIIAGVVSMGYNMFNHSAVLSAGASGAIFGLVGAMLYVVIRNKGRVQALSTRQIILFIVFSLYGGFTSNNVDNAAHIGGFLAGILLAVILVRRENYKERGRA